MASGSVGSRHTEFGGGPGTPARRPDGSAQSRVALDAGEKAFALREAAWDEIRGDRGQGVGKASAGTVTAEALARTNGYAAPAARGDYAPGAIAP